MARGPLTLRVGDGAPLSVQAGLWLGLVACGDVVARGDESPVDALPVTDSPAPSADEGVLRVFEAGLGGGDGSARTERDLAPFDSGPSPEVADAGPPSGDRAPGWPPLPDASHAPADLETPLPAQGPLGPSGRFVSLSAPESPAAALAMGCEVRGSKVGTGVGNLFALAGGVDKYLQPDEQGVVAFYFLARIPEWRAGTPVSALGLFDLDFVPGLAGPGGELLLDGRVYPQGDPAQAPETRFDHSAVNALGELNTPARPFGLVLPIIPEVPITLVIDGARVRGGLRVDAPGLAIRGGILTGYVPDASVLALVERVQAVCRAEPPPGLCALFGDQIQRPAEELHGLILGLLGGLDAYLEGAVGADCDAERACNAVSVCLKFEVDGVAVAGLAPQRP